MPQRSHAREESPPSRLATQAVRACLELSIAAAAGLILHALVGASGLGEPQRGHNIFFRLYWILERPHLVMAGAFGVGSAWWVTRMSRTRISVARGHFELRRPVLWYFVLCAGAFGVAATGWHWVMFETPLAMDEFSVQFQARMMAAGQWSAAFPEAWQSLARAVVPKFVSYDSGAATWSSAYWPVHAFIRSLFVRPGLEGLANPTLGVLTILAGSAVMRRLRPEWRSGGIILALALTTSAQFLVQGMTGYAMPVLLLFNTVWLYCWVRGDSIGLALAPLIGAVALGLHNPFPHALFVAPFLMRIVVERRWRLAAYFAAVYGIAIAAWFPWIAAHPQPWSAPAKFGLPNLWTLIVQSMSLVEVVTWSALWVAPCVILAARTWRTRTPTEKDLGMGLVLATSFYFCYLDTQGHGWGYRYLSPLAINLAVLAVAGVEELGRIVSPKLVLRWVGVGSALAILVQLPMRVVVIREFVRPFAAGIADVRGSPHQVVIVDAQQLWYGDDLVRNDPWLAPPVVLRGAVLTLQQRELLQRRFGELLRVVQPDEMMRHGWPGAKPPGQVPQ